jgi:hypothetical protein
MMSDDLSLIASAIPDAGEVVGCYFNDREHLGNRIVITAEGLAATVEGASTFLRYRDMSHVIYGDDWKDGDEIPVKMRSGSTVTIVIRGKDSELGTHDKAAVMMFLDSAISVHAPAPTQPGSN